MILLFIIITLIIFTLPLLPGFAELAVASDAKPLRVIQEYDTDPKYFATGFRLYLEKNFDSFFSTRDKAGVKFQEGELANGTKFQIIGKQGLPIFEQKEINSADTKKLLLGAFALTLPDNMFYETEIYGYETIKSGNNNRLRALMAEGDIEIGKGCNILRWVHSNASLSVKEESHLYGRATANNSITIAESCSFERLNAPIILFGNVEPARELEHKNTGLTTITEIPNVKDRYERRWLIDGDIHIKANSFFDGDLVATGNVVIGAGSHIKGSVKSNQDMYLYTGVTIEGSLFSAGDIHMETNCHVNGPVVAEDTILIESGSRIGSEANPTTVSALFIKVMSGVVAHGTIWADETADVIRNSATAYKKVAA